ncbi:MAG: substrate-binding domain-containing protein [bacterium]
MYRRRRTMVWLMVAMAVGLTCVSCRQSDGPQQLVIFHAGSLAGPMRDLATLFEERNPGVRVLRESSGSRLAARKITQLGRRADVLAMADNQVLADLVIPDHARWSVCFGRNRMVIAFTERSSRAAEFNAENWYEILLSPEVRYGHSDPDLDPCGYRTLLLWQLAEAHYGVFGLYDGLRAGCPSGHIRPCGSELLPLLESLDLDYIFVYESVARQHHLRYLPLPQEIDLGSPELASVYKKASVLVSGKTPQDTITMVGQPIVYAATIPLVAEQPALAAAFLELLVSEAGQRILERNFQTAIVPATTNSLARIPDNLRGLVSER